MNKDLPKVYANPINKPLTNNKDVYYSTKKDTRSVNNVDINYQINSIFASSHHVYKSKVHIKTVNDEFDTTIIGKSGNNLLTLSGEKININSIEDIKRL
ncbi:MAG: hypothetical protein NC483_01310 [Ruminococcus sp.]|nr:hypothetical protein [Ruminococcus sp.]